MIASISNYSSVYPSFRGNQVPKKNDAQKSEPQLKDPISKREVAAYGLAALSTGLFLKNRKSISKFVKLVESDVPKSTAARVNILGNAATMDAMTTLGNKKNLIINAFKDYKSAIKSGKNFNIAMLDMDNFKGINEVFDHSTGDVFLIRIAKNAKEIAQKHGAKSYRYGGEEFVITNTGKTQQEMQKMMEEISASIKNDSEIQKYLPEFKKKAKEQLIPLEKNLEFVQTRIFDNLRKPLSEKEAIETKENLLNFLKEYVEKYDTVDRVAINEITHKLNSSKNSELVEFLNSETKIGNETLKVQLDKLVEPYKDSRNDLLKWSNHIERYNAFTISGGFANIEPSYKGEFTSTKSLVDTVDMSLQMAKMNGKNTILEATKELLDKASAK